MTPRTQHCFAMFPDNIPVSLILGYVPQTLVSLLVLMAVCLTAVCALRWRSFLLFARAGKEDAQNGGKGTAQVTGDSGKDIGTPYIYKGKSASTDKLPYISIVIPSRNEGEAMRRTVEAMLSQDYAGRFEIVVANQLSSDDTALLLKRMQAEDTRVRSTFVPATSRYIELRKLAVTLGVRAARGEWVVVVKAGSMPYATSWLTALAAQLTDGRDLVIAYSNFDDNRTHRAHRLVYARLSEEAERYRDWRAGRVTDCPSSGYAVRKSWFMQCGGFSDSLTLPFGEEAILAARHADAARTAVLASRSARLIEPLPAKREWRALRTERAETVRHLGRAHRFTRLRAATATLTFYLFCAATTLYVAVRAAECVCACCYTPDWHAAADCAALVLLALWHAVPAAALRKCASALDERRYLLFPLIYSLARPLRGLADRCARYRHRHEFVRKYMSRA